MNIRYDLSANEKYAIEYLEKHNFEILDIHQHISKTKFLILKNGIKEIFELPSAVTNIKVYMNQYSKSFEMKEEIIRLKAGLGITE